MRSAPSFLWQRRRTTLVSREGTVYEMSNEEMNNNKKKYKAPKNAIYPVMLRVPMDFTKHSEDRSLWFSSSEFSKVQSALHAGKLIHFSGSIWSHFWNVYRLFFFVGTICTVQMWLPIFCLLQASVWTSVKGLSKPTGMLKLSLFRNDQFRGTKVFRWLVENEW